MTETSEPRPEPSSRDEPGNPTDEELDVEGPNESAPGHEPPPDEDGEGASGAGRPDSG